MRQNIQRTEQRGERIDEMDVKARGMSENADKFRRGTNRVYKDLRMKNVRMWIYLILGIAVLAIIIGLSKLIHQH